MSRAFVRGPPPEYRAARGQRPDGADSRILPTGRTEKIDTPPDDFWSIGGEFQIGLGMSL
jgi:hypothetical protein